MSTWDETRIAELRRQTMSQLGLYEALGGRAPSVPADVALSLLDELESVRRERDALVRDAGFLLEVADFALNEPGIVGTQTWLGAMEGVRSRLPGLTINVLETT